MFTQHGQCALVSVHLTGSPYLSVILSIDRAFACCSFFPVTDMNMLIIQTYNVPINMYNFLNTWAN